MKIHDVSMLISSAMPVYKNKSEKKPVLRKSRTLKEGANESKLEIESHTGTHADAFLHMMAKGKSIEKIGLDRFFGRCVVLDFTRVKDNTITLEDVKKRNSKIRRGDIVVLKTRNRPLKHFDREFAYLDKYAARFLSSKRIKAVGIDTLGIEREQPFHETHKNLFKKSIPVIEGLELSKIKIGRYFFIGFPLKIKGGDASPIRAVLVEGL